MDTKVKSEQFKKMVVICECGTEILVIPDLEEMAHCMKNHAAIHCKEVVDPTKSKAEYDRIEEQLTQKVILAITKMSN